MSAAIGVGIIGAGWPGTVHAKGYTSAGGFRVVAVADLIPSRRQKLIAEHPGAREYATGEELIRDKDVHAVSICVPNDLHATLTIAALRSGKHVVCEKPPGRNADEARRMERSAKNAGKVLMYSVQRRFGGAEQSARQAIARGYAGEVYHARATWMRTRGIPRGTGWYTDRERAGGGAMIDIGIHLLDLAWYLMDQPKPASVYGQTHSRLHEASENSSVDEAAFAMVRFEGGKTLELATSWAINQAPQQQGTICRVYGTKGAIEVYTPAGAVLYRGFDDKGEAKETPLKPPKVTGHMALMRHFRECMLGKATPLVGAAEGVRLMQMIDAIYQSAQLGRSVALR